MKPSVAWLLLSLLPTCALAQEFEEATAAKSLRFDAPDGHYQTWSGQVSCPVNAIRGVAHFERYGRPTTIWHPGIIIFVRAGEGHSERHVRLAFHARKYRPPFAVDLDSGLDDTRTLGHATFRIRPGSDNGFSFLIYWNGSGEVAAEVGGEAHTLRIGQRPDRIQINGTTGAGSVGFQFGHVSEGQHDECKPIA